MESRMGREGSFWRRGTQMFLSQGLELQLCPLTHVDRPTLVGSGHREGVNPALRQNTRKLSVGAPALYHA